MKRNLIFISLGSFAIVACVLTALRGKSISSDSQTDNRPIEYRATTDIGEYKPGENVVAEIPIRNRSAQPIRLFGIRTGCGCISAKWRAKDGNSEPLDEVSVSAGDTVTFLISTRTTMGQMVISTRVYFQTDHPDLVDTSVDIQGRVTLGVSTVPEAIAFDPIYTGEATTAKIRINDHRKSANRGPLKFTSDHSTISVTSVIPNGSDHPHHEYDVVLSFTSNEVTAVSHSIHVANDTGEILGRISCTGRVHPIAELVPSVVILPRSGSPDPNETRVDCRSRTPVRLFIDEEPPSDLTVRIDGNTVVVRKSDRAKLQTHRLRLRAQTQDNRDYPITLSITCVE